MAKRAQIKPYHSNEHYCQKSISPGMVFRRENRKYITCYARRERGYNNIEILFVETLFRRIDGLFKRKFFKTRMKYILDHYFSFGHLK